MGLTPPCILYRRYFYTDIYFRKFHDAHIVQENFLVENSQCVHGRDRSKSTIIKFFFTKLADATHSQNCRPTKKIRYTYIARAEIQL